MWQDEWEGKGVRRRIDTCMAETLCSPPKTITPLLISYTPRQNKCFKNKNKKQQLGWSHGE